MNPPPEANQDLEQLKLLAIFHYILAGITALFSCFPLFHVLFGILMATGTMDSGPRHDEGRIFGVFFAVIGCSIVLSGWALAVVMLAAGRFIAARRRHTFCVVVAGVSCIFMPLGTALGVFSLIVLMRPSVKALFKS